MKKIINLTLLLATIPMLSVCKPESTPDKGGNKISAYMVTPLGGKDIKKWFVWDESASIGFFSSENENVELALSEGAGTRSALFDGEIPTAITAYESVSACYPFKEGMASILDIDVSSQKWKAGDGKPSCLPLVAFTDVEDPSDISLPLRAALPIIRFRISNGMGEAVSVKSVSIESENNVFPEKGSMDMLASKASIKTVGALKNSISVTLESPLSLASGASVDIPLCLIPVNPGVFNLVVNFSDGTSYSVEKSVSAGFKAGSIYDFDIALLEGGNEEDELLACSFNIRFFDTNRPNYDYESGGQPWTVRRPAVKAFFKQNKPDVVALQEVRYTQFDELNEDLGDEYFIYCPGRLSGGKMTKTSDESVGVMYLKERFNMLDYGCFWLSESPNEVGSKRLGQDSPMIVSWLKLEEKTKPGKELWFFSLHISWSVSVNRALPDQETETLLSQAEYLTDIPRGQFKTSPIIMCGDLNNDETKSAIKTFRTYFNDARKTCPESSSTYRYTYNAYGDEKGQKIIDFFFYGKGTPLEYIVDNTTNYAPGVFYISDHYPLLFKLTY